ncbi:glutamyl-tRNA(Gln) amidotransferase subunit E [Methanosarcina thermophila]|jgi:glutamyl-tRNA(Gln) amidotransferase subunit E|uniref:Glutamyl-tRNA(Gln) amidotransferase subunit E n=3 Tax=Methanosarcina thermophila TaxID=2210 RepID=A0A1I7AAK7_METTE|nr:Glu-tRNA(Gln) amidotransferase subunit GatE [Methanosarcina thermophila]ALK06258.1 MAG: glutamyl-tRNA amidotransferase [Methanosarcina sp. 795]AKB12137.1 Glutamyl-tRNA(Gln) amidotransferase transferase subunit [Methanosarcina thermophila TM-1]AKB14660.1 Glutamyl-tRNA(Gln) amidotransferase transferase subunit [Methanosarcina thermophila CHTI-55]NLU56638.1 Glu-tRNA(Gln) amidotransferase subunit GatE [Methanosarcina thermophila]SFT71966.1 glutamyl-tRNA(Gln) amidotransferase subunit E [Methanos
MEKYDYSELGLKAGLEIHQQLDSKEKLFCRCPTVLRDVRDSNFEFFRYLRATESEMGEMDRAAVEQTKIRRKYIYKAYDTTCLVENDEEPPRELNKEALEISLEIAKLFNMKPVDQMHVMRKIVVDGSNTSGFQRTAFLASNGYIETSEGRCGIDSLCVEEEAAQKIEEIGDSIVYSLDRLGIPLVELATAPDIKSPRHAREVAEQIGMFLRSTGKVKRGLGTIRQDVNISISEGARVEIKGVQALDLIEDIVRREVKRQLNLLFIRQELMERKAFVCEEIYDVTGLFIDTKSKVLQKGVKKGAVLAALLRKFGGLVGKEVQPGRRLGTEFSDRAKTAGVGGIFHTDELPNYGITDKEVQAVRDAVGAHPEDAVIMVADEPEKARLAIEAVIARAKEAIKGVPEETRRALPDGNTAYMRPLPGAARMYPETDVPPIEISQEYFDSIEIPELLTERAKRFISENGLNKELAEKIAYSKYLPLFESLVGTYRKDANVNPTLIARTLVGIVPEIRRNGVETENLTDEHFKGLFAAISNQEIAKEAIQDLLTALAKEPELSVPEAISKLGLSAFDPQEVENFIKKTVRERGDFIKEKGPAALGPLMGIVMKEYRGVVDGKILSQMLKKELDDFINQV